MVKPLTLQDIDVDFIPIPIVTQVEGDWLFTKEFYLII